MIRKLFLAGADRVTSIAVGFVLALLARSLHIVIDPQSEVGFNLLVVAVLAAVYDLAARWAANRYSKRFPALPGLLGVTVKPTSLLDRQ